jgi:hypothetical protein
VLGKDWPAKTSRDPATIRGWFTDTDYGVFIHLGRSGAVAFDVDAPEHLPQVLVEAFRSQQPPHQPTRPKQPGRGHYVFAVPPGRKFGNGMGKLKTKEKWGEVRGTNGIIVAFPSVHENPDGCYGPWDSASALPVLPDSVADLLPDRTKDKARMGAASDGDEDGSDAATDTEVESFLATHTGNERPDLLGGVAHHFSEEVTQGSRHEAAVSALCWAMREAAVGLYPAQRAAKRLADMFIEAMAESTNGSDRILSRTEAASEFDGILAWAIGQVPNADLEEVRRSALARTPKLRHRRRLARPWTQRPNDNDVGSEHGEHHQEDDHSEGDNEPRSSWDPVDLKPVVTGDLKPPEPTMLARNDGACMIYPGKAHVFFGEKESLKTWLAIITVAQVLVAGYEVLYIDFEDNETTLVERLMALGVTKEQILAALTYIRPDEPLGDDEAQKMAKLTAAHHFALAVIDGVTEAMVLHDMDINDNTDSAAFQHLLARQLTDRGTAVVSIDHTSPTSTRREDKPIGAQHKQTGIDGAAYYFDAKTPLARALQGEPVTGITRIQVTKDRPGGVRGRSQNQKIFGELVLTAYPDGHLDYEIRPMTPSANWRPTVIMERISIYVENHDGANTKAIRRDVEGRGEWIDKGLAALIPEYVRVEVVGSAHRHYSVTPFRQPQSHANEGNERIFSADEEDLTDHGEVVE